MAIYHFSIKPLSRNKGRSSVSAAAYRAGEKLYDERQERTFNFLKKSDRVLFSEILTPEGSPSWMKEREKLWNAAEKCEKRIDSRVAKEVEVALSKELSLSQNIALLKEFVNEQFVESGLVADVNIHDQDKGNENIHAHVLLTTRKVVGEGFDLKKALELDKKDNLLRWREEWSNKVNYHLALNGYDTRIDHRSYKDQGIDLIPQNKRGPEFTRKKLAEKTIEHLEIARQNGEKIFEDPKIALHALSVQHSTFTKQDIARFISRHTDGAEQFTRVFEKVYNSPDLVVLGLDQNGNGRYSSKEMVHIEKDMVDIAQELSEKCTHAVDNPKHDRLSMAVSRAGKNIKELFVEPERFNYSSLSEEQKIAVDHITKGNDLVCVLGYAGTGKSYMLGAAKELWEKEGYRVRGLSLTGVAARGLEDGSGIKSQTLAKQFRSWEKGRDVLSERDIVVLDEVGMVASRQLHRVLYYVRNAGAKLVTTGDFSQLPSIEAGAAAKPVMEKVGYVELTEVRRQVEPWQQEATKQLARGEIEAAIDSYYQRGFVHKEEGVQQMLTKWASGLSTDKTQIMIAFTNAEVNQLNLHARKIMGESGILGEDHEVVTYNDKLKIAEHEKILFLRNNYDLGIMNGTLGEISAINQNEISVTIGEKICKIDVEKYNYFTYGYAATIHRLQGATFDNTQVLESPYFNRNLANVAFTRHRYEMNIYHSQDLPDMIKTISRDGSKDTTLDYPSCAKDIISYRDIQPLGDIGYTAFHHRDLVKELERIGEKDVSFMTAKQERGLVAGVFDHNSKQYLVLEQEKVFKLYNQNCFDTEKELINNIGCFVAITKQWDERNHAFNAAISNTGLSLLEPSERSKEHIFVLGKGVGELQDNIISLESKYQKPVDFNDESACGIYRGLTNIGDTKYGLIETASSLKMLSAERVDGIEENKWIMSKDQITIINQSEVPKECLFEAQQTVFGTASNGSFITSAIHEHKNYEIEGLRRSLTDSAETVVESLLGEPNAKLSSSTEWRYGSKGSLAVSVAGDKRGLWYNFETGESGDLIKLIQNQTGMSFVDTLKHAASMGSYIVLPKTESKNITKNTTVSKTLEYAQKLVAESKPIHGTVVERYLKEIRGINDISGDLRYHPKVYTKETQQYLPAMLSIGRDRDGNVQCVQATYLDPNTSNKADLDVNKRTYASPSGALVHLQKQGAAIESKTSYIAEGVETGLSIKDAIGPNANIAVTLGKSNFANIDPQSIGQKIVFCLDNDGIKVDKTIDKAAQRLIDFGKEVFIAIPEADTNSEKPEKVKTDFNDIARSQGIEAVKSIIGNPLPYAEWKNSIENSEYQIKHKYVANGYEEIDKKSSDTLDVDNMSKTSQMKHEESHPENAKIEQQNKAITIPPQNQRAEDLIETYYKLEDKYLFLNGIAEPHVIEELKESMERCHNELKQIIDSQDKAEFAEDKYVTEHVKETAQLGLEHERENSDKQFVKEPEEPAQLGRNLSVDAETNPLDETDANQNVDEKVEQKAEVTASEFTENTPEEILKAKIDTIVKECTKLIASINYCNSKQEKFAKEGTSSPFLKESLEENKASIRQCLQNNCGRDKEVLNHLKQHEPALFNDINKVCSNILTNTIKSIESRELLTNITKDQPELQDRVLSAEKQYKELEQKNTNAKKEIGRLFKSGCIEEEIDIHRKIRDSAEKELNIHANTICNDVEVIKAISQHDKGLFQSMNQRFDNMFIEVIKKDELHKEYISTHAESFGKTISKEERISNMYKNYKETKQEYMDSRKEVIKMFNAGCTEAELKEPRETRNNLEKEFKKYANDICRDKDFMDHLSKNDAKEFNEMNERFNELMREQMEDLQKELERNL
ncbi:MAG: Ti-type conjugative transfer relaxase TraA [bacterium]